MTDLHKEILVLKNEREKQQTLVTHATQYSTEPRQTQRVVPIVRDIPDPSTNDVSLEIVAIDLILQAVLSPKSAN